jgi:hypothetical protein
MGQTTMIIRIHRAAARRAIEAAGLRLHCVRRPDAGNGLPGLYEPQGSYAAMMAAAGRLTGHARAEVLRAAATRRATALAALGAALVDVGLAANERDPAVKGFLRTVAMDDERRRRAG